MEEAVPAPNPWTADAKQLPGDCAPLDPAGILDRIRRFLRGWPGLVTSLLEDDERHSRLIQTIAGYAFTESSFGSKNKTAPTPFDTPLDIQGISSFELTLALDSIKSVNSTSSLWTEILEYEYKHGGPIPNVPDTDRTIMVLALLFVGLGEKPPLTKKERPQLSRAAQSLLAEIFSYTNEGLSKWGKVISRMRNVPIEGFDVDDGFVSRTSEFKRIQSWMDEILPNKKRNPGLSQRYVRGGSSLINACLSSIRSKSHEMNYSNILIDGGGRIVQKQRSKRRGSGYSPHGGALQSLFGLEALELAEIESSAINKYQDKAREERLSLGDSNYGEHHLLNNSEGIIQAICPLSSTYLNENADPNTVLEETSSGWRKTVHEAEETENTIESIVAEANDRILKTFRIVDNNTPNRSVVIWDIDDDAEMKMTHIYGGSYSEEVPARMLETMELRPRKIVPWDDGCPRCNADLPMDSSENNITRLKGSGYCFGHQLLHSIGDRQRTRDSSLRQPSARREVDGGDDPLFPDLQRTVVSIARIDGNSIGWILNPTRFDDSGHGISDSIRRRSMRFNAHWWISLSKALHEVNDVTPDKVACWVSAGDDIMLAEYSGGDVVPGSAIIDAIERFTGYLDGGINRELAENPEGPLASHCTGISIRGAKGDSIADMMDRASIREISAKLSWKEENESHGSGRIMISKEKLDRESFRIKRMLIDPVQEREGAIPVLDIQKLEEIAEFQSLDISDEDGIARLREICLRAEAVENEGRIRILISGRGDIEEPEDLGEEGELRMGELAESLVFTD